MEPAGAHSPHLEKDEQAQAAHHSAPRALVVHEIVREEGEIELARRPFPLVVSGFAGGLSMGFSYLALAILRGSLPDEPWRHLVASLGYTVGFVIVVLGRQQLFTESTLTAMLPVLTRRDIPSVRGLARVWGLVLVANIAGTWLMAALLSLEGIVEPEMRTAFADLADETMAHPFLPTFLRAILAGWLIALMVWLLPSAGSARILVIVLLTYVVALAHLSHIIAGSSEAAYAVLVGGRSFADYAWLFFAPTLLGNVVGGVGLVAFLNHAAVAPEVVPRDGE
jgi:formate/nitrite transporter FocA (FNT family)